MSSEEPVAADDPAGDPVRTGVSGVDEVIRAVEELEERPLEEHVGVFEASQSRLRQALDDRGEPGGAGDPSDD
jgi:hypothetical protein